MPFLALSRYARRARIRLSMSEISSNLSLLRLLSPDRNESTLCDMTFIERSCEIFAFCLSLTFSLAALSGECLTSPFLDLRGEGALGEESVPESILSCNNEKNDSSEI